MKSLASALFLLFLQTPGQAAESHAFCQVKLLKAATDGLEKEFAQKGQAVGEITEIVYNYNLAGKPRVIFLARNTADRNELCFMDVATRAPAEYGDVCPEYKFFEVRTNCQPKK